MRNEIEYAIKYQKFIDEELVAQSKTQWMVPADDQIEYDGGDEIKIAEISTSGLGNYDENSTSNAYPSGKVTQKWNSYKFTMDRAVDFLLQRTTPSDSGFIATAENVIKIFTNKEVVKELDTYRLNRIYNALLADTKYAASHVFSEAAITESNIIATFNKMINIAKEDSEDATALVAYMPISYGSILRGISKNTNNAIEFGKTVVINGITYKGVIVINEIPVLLVPKKRLVTKLVVNDGRTSGQTDGGVISATDAKQIHMLVVGTDAPIAAAKIDSLKQFSAEENQLSDGTAIKFHQKHDCWVKKNQIVTVAAVTVPTV
ncbi:MAG: hypothetical protein RR827_06850 [Oscillospiraceae bacterium]